MAEYYVDPAIAADSGAGTIGDPFGDLQYALDNVTRDTGTGDRFNIKSGTDEVLSSALTLATYGTPTEVARLDFRGYSSTLGDGGIGGISGGGSVTMFASTAYNNITLQDLHLHSTGTADIVTINNYWNILNCEFDNTSGTGVLSNGLGPRVIGCHLHNLGNRGVAVGGSGSLVSHCYIHDDGANQMTNGIRTFSNNNNYNTAHHNIVSLSGSGVTGIHSFGQAHIEGNSILATGTGTAIEFNSTPHGRASSAANNLIEGWTTGILGTAASSNAGVPVVGNAFFDCDTNLNLHAQMIATADNEALSATPFAKTGSDTFANRAAYFAPVDTGNVYSAYGGLGTKGAVSLTSAGGGGGGGTTGRQGLHAIEAGAV